MAVHEEEFAFLEEREAVGERSLPRAQRLDLASSEAHACFQFFFDAESMSRFSVFQARCCLRLAALLGFGRFDGTFFSGNFLDSAFGSFGNFGAFRNGHDIFCALPFRHAVFKLRQAAFKFGTKDLL